MAQLTKKEFADQTGQTTKTLSTYILRKKVVVNKAGLIDTNNEINKAFIAIHAWKKVEKPSKKAALPTNEDEEDMEDADVPDFFSFQIDPMPSGSGTGDGLPDLIVSEKRYKHALANKTEAAEELDRLRIKKLKGDVVPSAPIGGLVFQFKQYILTQQKIAYERFLTEITHKYSIAGADMAEYRTFFIKELNAAAQTATDLFLKDLDNTLSLFSVKKAV